MSISMIPAYMPSHLAPAGYPSIPFIHSPISHFFPASNFAFGSGSLFSSSSSWLASRLLCHRPKSTSSTSPAPAPLGPIPTPDRHPKFLTLTKIHDHAQQLLHTQQHPPDDAADVPTTGHPNDPNIGVGPVQFVTFQIKAPKGKPCEIKHIIESSLHDKGKLLRWAITRVEDDDDDDDDARETQDHPLVILSVDAVLCPSGDQLGLLL